MEDEAAARLARVIDKVRKLRALSASANLHEAAAAAAAAERLLLAHEIDEAQIARGAPANAARAGASLDTLPANVPRWRSHLAAYLARIHGCATWLDPTWDAARAKATWDLRIAGRPADVAVTRELYTWLADDVARLAVALSPRAAVRNAFAWGAVLGIHQAIERARAELHAAAPPAALAHLEARSLEAAAMAPPGLRAARAPAPIRDGDAFERGRLAGSTTLHDERPAEGARPRRS